MPRVVRMMAHVETDLPASDITHVYLHGAAAAAPRPDPGPRGARRGRAPSDGTCTGPVLVVGAGLLGTSVGLALRAPRGRRAAARRRDAEHVRIATGLGAGRRRRRRPPGRGWWWSRCRPTTSPTRSPTRCRGTDAVVTDVGSVKAAPLRRGRGAASRAEELARYVGSHPMAGSERSGPLAASAALFDGRPWAVAAARRRRPRRGGRGHRAGQRLRRHAVHVHPRGARRRRWPAPPTCRTCWPRSWPAGSPTRRASHLVLSGQGVRDVTRIAAGDPALWQQILAANTDGAEPRCCARCATTSTRCSLALDTRRPRARSAPCSTAGVAGTAVDPRQARRPGGGRGVGVRRRPRPPRRAGPAVRRRRRDRGQHRGPAHRPRPGPPVGLVELSWPPDRGRAPASALAGGGAGPTHR